jgi:hypothetical protein
MASQGALFRSASPSGDAFNDLNGLIRLIEPPGSPQSAPMSQMDRANLPGLNR